AACVRGARERDDARTQAAAPRDRGPEFRPESTGASNAWLLRLDYRFTMPAVNNVDLTHHFLIAMPAMVDPHFAKSLTFVCEHNEQGALGVVVNRPIEMTLKALFDQIDIPLHDAPSGELPVYFGGPVQVDRGFVLHRPPGEWQSTLSINKQ